MRSRSLQKPPLKFDTSSNYINKICKNGPLDKGKCCCTSHCSSLI